MPLLFFDLTLNKRRAGKAEMNLDPTRITASRANRGSSVENHYSTTIGAAILKQKRGNR
jgi:hypothetical protein